MEKKMKVFVSGPMTGYEKHNFPKFDEVSAWIRGLGILVANPALVARSYKEQEVLNDPEVFKDMIRSELAVLVRCSHIFLLKGWERSVGAKRELKIALDLGLEVVVEGTTADEMRSLKKQYEKK